VGGTPRCFKLVLIKPSHYDDDGYVIQWFRSAIPSNTLAVMYGLALDCKRRRVLGENVEIVVSAFDETNSHIRTKRLARELSGGRGMLALIGVQSNQFPRAIAIARPLRQAGVPVGPWISGSPCSPERPRDASKRFCAMPGKAQSARSTTT
jgi:hypothetical protein